MNTLLIRNLLFSELPQPIAEEIEDQLVTRRTIFVPREGSYESACDQKTSFEVYPEIFEKDLWLNPTFLEKFLTNTSVPFDMNRLTLKTSEFSIHWCGFAFEDGDLTSVDITFKNIKISFDERGDDKAWYVDYDATRVIRSTERLLNVSSPFELRKNMERFDILLVCQGKQLSFHSTENPSDAKEISYVRQGQPTIVLCIPVAEAATTRQDAENLVKQSVFWQLF